MNFCEASPLYRNVELEEKLQRHIKELSDFYHKRKEVFLEMCFNRHAPGVVRLMKSGQRRAASIYATLQGFKLWIHYDGAITFVRHDVSLELLPAPLEEMQKFKLVDTNVFAPFFT